MLRRQKHFSVLLAILLIAGFVVTSWLSYQVASSSIESHISNDTLPLTSDIIYSEIQHDLFRPIFISSIMAQDPVVRHWGKVNEKATQEKIINYLQEIQSKYNTITSYFISDATLNYYHPTGITKKISKSDPKDQWYFTLKKTPVKHAYEVNIDHYTVQSEMTVFVNYKVYDNNNQFIGAVGVGLALETVKELIEDYQQRYRRTIYFTNKDGDITLHGNALQNGHLADRIQSKKLINLILNSSTTSLHYTRNNEKVYLNSRFIKEFNWYLVIEQDAVKIETKLNRTFQINIALSVLVTIGVLLIAHIAFNRYQSKLVMMASIDKLSSLLNREAFEPIINNNMEQAKRKNKSLSLILLDIDHFKQVNDTYGHLTGDKVIQHVAHACKLHSRESDAVCRWGGEEFIIMLADTPIEGASVIANRIKTSLAKTEVEPKVTASFGITTYHSNEQLDDFLNRADNALYQAKRNGRDRIEVIE